MTFFGLGPMAAAPRATSISQQTVTHFMVGKGEGLLKLTAGEFVLLYMEILSVRLLFLIELSMLSTQALESLNRVWIRGYLQFVALRR